MKLKTITQSLAGRLAAAFAFAQRHTGSPSADLPASVTRETCWREGTAIIPRRSAHTHSLRYDSPYCNGVLHRTDGPAIVERDDATGIIIWEEWRKDGQLHRPDGPAMIIRDPATAITTHESWHKDGLHHRNEAPAYIERDPTTAVVVYESWWKDGVRTRPDGPAELICDRITGAVTRDQWWQDGQPIPAPAPTPTLRP